jgi:hypothetical protein
MTTTQEAQPPELIQLVAYHKMRQALKAAYLGQWVVIFDSKVVGHYETYDEARTGARGQGLNLLDCLIQKVGAEPPIILSYSD